MKHWLKSLSEQIYRAPAWLLIVIAVAVKLGVSIYFASLSNPDFPQTLFSTSGDTPDYIEPIENLYTTGVLYTELHNNAVLHRMPGFLPFYLPLRFVFSPDNALNALVVLQSMLSGICCYLLALMAVKFNSDKKAEIFSITFIIAVISISHSIFDRYILSESLSTALLVGAMLLFLFNFKKKRTLHYLLAGGLFAMSVFLKPYFIFIQLYFLFYLIFLVWNDSPWVILRKTGAFVLITVLSLSAWSTYYHHMKGEWVLLQKSEAHTGNLGEEEAAFSMMKEATRITGGQFIEWDPDGSMYHLLHPEIDLKENVFPEAFYSDSLTLSDVDEIRTNYKRSETTGDSALGRSLKIEITTKLRNAIAAYEINHLFDRHVASRVRAFVRFYFQRGAILIPFPPRAEQTLWQQAIKAFYTLLHWLVMIVGTVGLIKHIFIRPSHFGFFFGGIVGFILVLFPIVLIASEQRYIVIAYAMILPFFAYVLTNAKSESIT